jgi:hypothetical protein
METLTKQNISLLDRVKLQTQVLLPVLHALRVELGEERANRVVFTALREWSRNLFHQMGAQFAGSPQEKWQAIWAVLLPQIGNDVDYERLRDDGEARDFNITGCRYAEFFRQLNEPELGAVLLCEMDLHIAEVGSPEVEFTRTQTIMKGSRYCDFRHRLKKPERTGTAS